MNKFFVRLLFWVTAIYLKIGVLLHNMYTGLWGNLHQEWYDNYYNVINFNSHPFALERYLLANMHNSAPQSTVIDIGCGEGLGCEILSRNYACKQVIGIDRDANAIQTASTRFAANSKLRFECVDIAQLQAAQFGSTINLVSCFSVIQFLDSTATAHLMHFIKTVLVPGGKCVGSITMTAATDLKKCLGVVPKAASADDIIKNFFKAHFASVELLSSNWNNQRREVYFICS